MDVRAAAKKERAWSVIMQTPSFWETIPPAALRRMLCARRGWVADNVPLVWAARIVFARHSLSCAQAARVFALGRTVFLRLAGDGRKHLPVAHALEAALARRGGLKYVAAARAARARRKCARMEERLHMMHMRQLQWLRG